MSLLDVERVERFWSVLAGPPNSRAPRALECRMRMVACCAQRGLQHITRAISPGYLAGISFGDWLRLLSENRFSIAPRFLPRAAAVSVFSILNSLTLGGRAQDVPMGECAWTCEPLFILGHWRSGTTHLLNLLGADARFVAPTLLQVVFPRCRHRRLGILKKMSAPLVPRIRAVDGMRLSLDALEEDERALCVLFRRSPYLSMVFPNREREYDRYLTLADVPAEERRRWQAALLGFVRRLAATPGRTPLLKSPPHTCRIRLLLDLFPRAKFVHIHRHPFEVFQSTRHLLAVWHERHAVQHRDLTQLDERVIRQYREMYDVFFRERSLIPEGQFHEIAFANLEREPRREIRALYERLTLPALSLAELRIERYLASVAGYKRNNYDQLPRPTRERILKEWAHSFDEWEYSRGGI
jgi:hypothetical protein